MPDETEQITLALAQLSPAPEGWLKSAVAKLRRVTVELSAADSPDEVMRRAILLARSEFGFNRIGAWFFEEGRRSLTGTFGVDAQGNITDERHCRVFDRGSIPPQIEAWSRAPYYFVKPDDMLRDSEGGAISTGVHITAPLMDQGNIVGYLTIDDLLEGSAVNQESGVLLGLLADAISAQYFRKVAESRAFSAEAASERSDLVKREFLGVLSHEVRTPLNAILGFAQLLCLESDSPTQAQLAKTIEQSGDHLLNLLNGMMDYANLAYEDLRKRFCACHPVAIIEETVQSFSEIAASKGVLLEFKHEGGFEGAALADPVGLRQILGNLVQNGIKFTKRGAVRVSVQTQVKPLGAVEFFITVEDTGCGIAPQHLASIFKPFEQIDSSMTRDHGGIGMGLAIVERLVWSMGGRINCESSLGSGSRFTIDFVFECVGEAPVATRDEMLGTRAPAEQSRSKLKLLISEDNETNRNLLLSLLARLGYPAPDQSTNGEEAAELIAQRPYDMLLLDLQMPKIDGLTLTRMVREGRCGPINADVPIIGLTAHNDEYDRERCTAAGMNEYLVKPFKVATLQAAIGEIIKD